MGNPTMEITDGKTDTSVAIFIGIAITERSLLRGLANFKFWHATMQAFRSFNENLGQHGKRMLPEHVLARIQGHLKVVKDEPGRQRVYHNDLTDHDLKLIEKSFALTIQFQKPWRRRYDEEPVYLCIPWDFHSRLESQTFGTCCEKAEISVSESLYAGYTEPTRQQGFAALFVDQDLQITREKILAINRAIQDLDLEVNTERTFSSTTECDVESKRYTRFEKATFGGKDLWKPRIVILLHSDLVLEEVRSD